VEQEIMYTVYAIYNKTAKKYYIGQTKDIKKRLTLHNNHTFKSYTSRFPGEWLLIYQESAAIRSEALKREKQLKSGNGRMFIKSLIPG
jgi:putative endonuclease